MLETLGAASGQRSSAIAYYIVAIGSKSLTWATCKNMCILKPQHFCCSATNPTSMRRLNTQDIITADVHTKPKIITPSLCINSLANGGVPGISVAQTCKCTSHRLTLSKKCVLAKTTGAYL